MRKVSADDPKLGAELRALHDADDMLPWLLHAQKRAAPAEFRGLLDILARESPIAYLGLAFTLCELEEEDRLARAGRRRKQTRGR